MYNQGFSPYRRMQLFIVLIGLMVLPLLLMAFPRSVQAQGACTGSQDYGDALASYGDACATTPSTTLYIGSVPPDAESGSQSNAAANGDSINGTNDENFLNPLTPIDVSNSTYLWSVPVTNTTGNPATLAGWIDFNGNGVFDANEGTTVNVPSGGSTVVQLTWNIPITASFNITTYVRLRLSPNSSVGPTGTYGVGEVEDYAAWMPKGAKCDPGTSFYYADGGPSPLGNGPTGDTTINTVNASTGVTTTFNNPPTLSGTDAINGLAVDNSRALVFFQNAGNTTARGIYGYNVFTSQNFTVTTNASGLGITGLANGWLAAAGAFANGKYYVGVDGDDSGGIWEITLDAAGTTAVSARRLLTNPNGPSNGCGGAQCNDFGDILIDGNRLYISVAQNTAPYEAFDVWDINSQTRLSHQTIAGVQWDAFQLGRDGNGNIYAVTTNNGSIFSVTNGAIDWNGGTPLRSINRLVRDASECLVTRTPTAVTVSSFSARTEMFDGAGRGIAIGAVGAVILAGLVLVARRRQRGVAP